MNKNLSKISSAVALLLVLSITTGLMTLPTSAAQTKKPSYGFVSTTPQTVQLGQSILINAWTSPTPPSGYMGAPVTETFRQGYIFTFTRPDGTTDTLGPKSSYADGTCWATYTPDQIGTWTVKLTWAGDDIFAACESPAFSFTVQQEAVPSWPAASPPSGYWARPVNAENREWAQYLGDWLMSGYDARGSNFNPYAKAPETAHILWRQPVGIGGIMSGEFNAAAYRSTVTPIILGGRVFYSKSDGIHCVDLYTGQTLWIKSIPGSLFYVTCPADKDPGGAATHADIWSSQPGKVEVYDAFTGALTKTMTDPGIGISKYHDGYFYFISGTTFTKWDPYGGYEGVGTKANFTTKTVWSTELLQGAPTPSLYWEDIATDVYARVAYNLTTGELMWNTTRDTSYLWRAPAIDKGRLMIADVNMRWHAFDLYNNGAELWVSEPAEYPWGAFWTYACACAYDKAYGTSYDGHVYAFDINTGDIVWSFYSGDSHGETPYGTWPFWGTTTVADGKVYASTTEHTPTQPRGRGNNLFCINDADGKEIWRIAGAYANTKAIADGMLLASNEYDSMLYCFGKGPSATTVTATAGVGNAITIQGTVTDISGGAKQLIEQNLFNIVPAVSDDDMSNWMEYLYMQKPMPTNAKGVPVTLYVSDQNSNVIATIQSTTDVTGHYAASWVPTNSGLYTIIADFNGTKSYYGSTAVTSIAVGTLPTSPAPTSSPSVVPGATSVTGTEIYIGIAAVVIIAAVVAVAMLLRRRR